MVFQPRNHKPLRIFFCRHLFLRRGGSQFTQFYHCRNVIFFHNRPLFSNFQLFRALKTQLTFMAVGEPDYARIDKSLSREFSLSWLDEKTLEMKTVNARFPLQSERSLSSASGRQQSDCVAIASFNLLSAYAHNCVSLSRSCTSTQW